MQSTMERAAGFRFSRSQKQMQFNRSREFLQRQKLDARDAQPGRGRGDEGYVLPLATRHNMVSTCYGMHGVLAQHRDDPDDQIIEVPGRDR